MTIKLNLQIITKLICYYLLLLFTNRSLRKMFELTNYLASRIMNSLNGIRCGKVVQASISVACTTIPIISIRIKDNIISPLYVLINSYFSDLVRIKSKPYLQNFYLVFDKHLQRPSNAWGTMQNG